MSKRKCTYIICLDLKSFGNALRVINLTVFCCSSSVVDNCMVCLGLTTPATNFAKFTRPVLSCGTVVQTITHIQVLTCDLSQDS
jgi:hypothetical protein